MPDERPREVFLAACDAIAAALAPRGFSYAKSGPSLTQRAGDLTFRIHLQSSHRNVPGAYVAFWPYALVHSRALKRWRQTHTPPLYARDLAAGGHLQNLHRLPTLVDWNLAPPAQRAATVEAALSALQHLALPYFDRFREPSRLVERLQVDDVPAMFPTDMLEYVLCFGTRDQARQVFRRLLTARPQWMRGYEEYLERNRSEGPTQGQVNSYAEELARAAVMYDLEP